MARRCDTVRANLHQCAIAADQLVNTAVGVLIGAVSPDYRVWADETMSASLWRNRRRRGVNVARLIVDVLFMPTTGWRLCHCRQAFESEMRASQNAPDYRP